VGMSKSYSMDLRSRVVAAVEGGSSRREAARRFGVSPSCAVKLLARVQATGSAEPGRRGRRAGSGKLGPFEANVIAWVKEKPDITLPELARRLEQTRGVKVHPSALSRLLGRTGWTYKKSLAATEIERADVANRCRRWFRWLLPWLCQRLSRLVFLDETSITTRMTRLRGRALRGQRLRAKAAVRSPRHADLRCGPAPRWPDRALGASGRDGSGCLRPLR
jgi:transposase